MHADLAGMHPVNCFCRGVVIKYNAEMHPCCTLWWPSNCRAAQPSGRPLMIGCYQPGRSPPGSDDVCGVMWGVDE